MIYTVDSVIHPLNNQGLLCFCDVKTKSNNKLYICIRIFNKWLIKLWLKYRFILAAWLFSVYWFKILFLFYIILSAPYDTYRPTKESVIRAFWVQASSDSQAHKLSIPMLINTTLHQDQFLTQDLLNELVSTMTDLQSKVEIWEKSTTF